MYYIEQDSKIVLFNDTLEGIEYCLQVLPQYQGLEIQETAEGYTIVDFKLITIEEYTAQQLEKAKQAKIQENDTARDMALNAGVTYKDVLFDSDTDQKVNLLAIVSTMSTSPDGRGADVDEQREDYSSGEGSTSDTIIWYGKDNQPLNCTKEDLLNIGSLITQLHSFCWNRNAEIKYLINVAETLDELEEININYALIN